MARTQPPAETLTWTQVMAWRAKRHLLDRRIPRRRLLEVVGAVGGLHAQLMSSAELSLWARLEGLKPEHVRAALWERRILVKLWAMRGTLHLLPSAEYPLWQAALSTYRHYEKPSWSRYFGVTPAEVERLISAVGEALDGRELTREELAEEVARITRSKKLGDGLRESWGALLKPPSFRGTLCFAPGDGQRVRFTNPRSWLGDASEENDTAAALQEVVRRFLGANGPATREDVARWWAGISPARAARLIRELDDAVEVDVEGERRWMLRGDVAEATDAEPSGSVRLLPAFDPYVIGATKHADRLMPGPFRDRVYRPQAWVRPVLLVDGRMDGVWTYERKGKRLEVEIEPFVKLSAKVRRAAEEEAAALAHFLDGRLELTWTP